MEETAVLGPLRKHVLHMPKASLEPLDSVRRPVPDSDEDHDTDARASQHHELGLDQSNMHLQAWRQADTRGVNRPMVLLEQCQRSEQECQVEKEANNHHHEAKDSHLGLPCLVLCFIIDLFDQLPQSLGPS